MIPRGPSIAKAICLSLFAALLGAAFIVPAGAETGKDLKQSWKYVRAKLSAPGTINAANNPVDWTQLKNVPEGIADSIDDVGSGACGVGAFVTAIQTDGTLTCHTPAGAGDVTGVAAGTGLVGGGTSGDVGLSADPTYLQRRVTTDCGVGFAVSRINEDGTTVCRLIGAQASEGSKEGGSIGSHQFPNTLSYIAGLNLGVGKFAVFAKLVGNNYDAANRIVTCQLLVPGSSDTSSGLAASFGYTMISMMSLTNSTANDGTATVKCTDFGTPTDFRYESVKIIVIPLTALSTSTIP